MDVERTIEFLLHNAARSDARFNASMDRIAASQTRSEARHARSEARLDRDENVLRLAIRRGIRRERRVNAEIRALTEAQRRSDEAQRRYDEAQRRADEKLTEAQRRTDAKFERLIDMLVKHGTNGRPR